MLFSHRLFVQRLLESFVEEPFTAGLDYSTLERVNASFVSDEFARRESDIIWKATFAGRPLYLFILIEFQSSVDHHMPIRFLRYLAEFYQSFATEPERLAETIDEVIAILSEKAVERFSLWLQNFLAATTGGEDAARPVRDLTEVRTMFATKLEQYGEKLKREARKEGLERGLEKGREENALPVARRLLARGESVSEVAEITELSETRVRALRVEDDTR